MLGKPKCRPADWGRRVPGRHPRRLAWGRASHTAALAQAAGFPTHYRRYRVRSGGGNNLMPGLDVSGKSGWVARSNGTRG
jgi:hypothetical protein